jgi:predicted alpha-1,2-mannosidase
MKYFKTLVPLLLIIIFGCANASGKKNFNSNNYTKYVNPFIGTDAKGHTFPGALLPFGMVQLSPDTRVKTSDGSSGYHYSDKSIMGFTHTHYSGTGEGSGGDFLFMPTVGKVQLSVGDVADSRTGYRSSFSHKNESASPGYYKVLLDDYNITAELTATKRVGFHKYTFPNADSANIILDLEHGINDKSDSLYLKVISNTKIAGYRASIGGLRLYQKLYFVAEFSEPFENYGMMIDGQLKNNLSKGLGKSIKAYFQFKNVTNPILIKVAISKVDIDGAENNLTELPGWNFDTARDFAKDEWNKELQKIDVDVNDSKIKTVFYTALYHASTHPSLDMDLDGRYRSTNNKIYTATDFVDYTNFSLWDTFRGLHPLHTIINPTKANDFVRTFVERFEHSGSLPIFELSGNEVPSMIGYHSLPVIADAYVKGIRNYDVDKAIEGMKRLANLPWEKRNLFKTFGFVPYDYTVQSVSRTLEYSFDDWSLAQVVKNINEDDYRYYSNRGSFYKNLFDENVNFMRPKNSNHQWLTDFTPIDFSKYYTQANAYQYTTFVPQNVHELIRLMGGDKAFKKWLDKYFSTEINGRDDLIGQYNHGNEPSHHTAYLYNYTGASWKTQQRVREILSSQYGDTPDGLSGNDDAGQMSAWYVLSAMGFYSVTPGMDYYVIGSPLFNNVKINLENGNTFEIIAKNTDSKHPYIQSVTLNGKPYLKSYIKHRDIVNGGKFIFEMGDKPNHSWGSRFEDRPYSLNFNSVSTPRIIVKNNQTPPDGTIIFKDNCTVSLLCDEKDAKIFYTTDGSEPDTTSLLYADKFVIAESKIIKAKAFKTGLFASYTTPLEFRKLDLIPSKDISNLSAGISYEYREVWLCKQVDDITYYPVLSSGVLPKIDADLGIKVSEKNGVIYNGYIKIPTDTTYTFYLDSDDGSVLLIDDILVVNNDGSHRSRERSGKIALAKGFHSIVVKHFQVGGKPKLTILWESDEIKKGAIPESQFFH